MKTLKFMLAAATAIGLASATQADQYNTTGFEKLAVGTKVVTGVKDNSNDDSYFYYAGSVAEDNESEIAEGTPNIGRPRGASAVDATRNNILQVSTGTDPLMRTYAPTRTESGELKPQDPSTITVDTYVDTLVQFTVTPYTDTVTPGGADKLMIYLKESVVTNELGEVTDGPNTNLVVVGGYFNGGTTVAREYGLNTGSVTVNPNEWHRLTVKAVVDLSGSTAVGFPGFQIWVDGELCTLADSAQTYDAENSEALELFSGFEFAEDIDAGKYVLSLLAGSGEQEAKLQGVGFAGEGKVDDIVFSELNPFATLFDFTFTAWDSSKVDAVSYTVGATSYIQAGTYEVEEGTKIKINSITYKTGWEEGSFTVVGLADPDQDGYYTVTNTASFTIIPAEVQSTPLEPGQQDPTTYDTQAAAEAAAAKVTVGVPTAVATALTPAQQETYATLFEAKVVSNGAGGYKVEVGLTATAETALQAQVDADVAEVIEDLSESTVTLTTTPGLYYSFEYGTTLEGMAEVGTRQLATGNTLTLDRPTTANATAGFYKVLVNIAPAASAQE